MSPWNQKYIVHEDIKPAVKTGCPILCFLSSFIIPCSAYCYTKTCGSSVTTRPFLCLILISDITFMVYSCMLLTDGNNCKLFNSDKVKDRVNSGWLWSPLSRHDQRKPGCWNRSFI